MIEAEGLFDRIRSQCRKVTERARSVRIDAEQLEAFAARFAQDPWPEEDLDPAHHFVGNAQDTLAFMVALDAINFGSGWFPLLRKRPGCSGYRTIATACKEHVEREGHWTAAQLRKSTPAQMAQLLGQDASQPEVAELMTLFAQAWQDLGQFLEKRFGGRFENLIESADHSAEQLARQLAEMPLYRDVAVYEDLEVPLYKRAQITAADLHRAFGSGPVDAGEPAGSAGWGHFEDLDRMTLFADNLVPHVLRCEGVLVYTDDLAARIDSRALIPPGSPEETEIRAVAVDAVEGIVARLADLGRPTSAWALDGLLWNAGQAKAIKARPRHRARSTYY